jgi:hypothetical protein
MDRRFTKNVGLALILSLSGVVFACAAPTIPDGGGLSTDDPNATSASSGNKKTPKTTSTPGTGTAAPEGDAPPASTDTAPAPTTTAPPPTTPPTAQCAGQTGDACFDCCNTASGGTLGAADKVFGQCACLGGQCTVVCALNFCSGTAPSAACKQCLDTTCVPAENAACTSDSCKAGLACLQQCN